MSISFETDFAVVSMKVVAYSILEHEKELLALANAKCHDITYISNGLNVSTLHYAMGKEVVIVSHSDIIDRFVLEELERYGIKKIITRSVAIHHIDMEHAAKLNIHIANTPFVDQSDKGIAMQAIYNLNNWQQGNCLNEACQCHHSCPGKVNK